MKFYDDGSVMTSCHDNDVDDDLVVHNDPGGWWAKFWSKIEIHCWRDCHCITWQWWGLWWWWRRFNDKKWSSWSTINHQADWLSLIHPHCIDVQNITTCVSDKTQNTYIMLNAEKFNDDVTTCRWENRDVSRTGVLNVEKFGPVEGGIVHLRQLRMIR